MYLVSAIWDSTMHLSERAALFLDEECADVCRNLVGYGALPHPAPLLGLLSRPLLEKKKHSKEGYSYNMNGIFLQST